MRAASQYRDIIHSAIKMSFHGIMFVSYVPVESCTLAHSRAQLQTHGCLPLSEPFSIIKINPFSCFECLLLPVCLPSDTVAVSAGGSFLHCSDRVRWGQSVQGGIWRERRRDPPLGRTDEGSFSSD